MEVWLFINGNTAVIGDDGMQMPELQQSWLVLFAEYLESEGFDPTKVDFTLPSGLRVEMFKTSNNDYNWRIK
jgi:hypothetical protein